MFLTKECDYGIRIIRALADGQKKSVEIICELEYIPNKFAYKIIRKLHHAGFVRSLRGRDGGYKLVKSLDSFTIYDIVSAIDNNLLVFGCLKSDNNCPHKGTESDKFCPVHLEYDRIQKILDSEMQLKTISDIMM